MQLLTGPESSHRLKHSAIYRKQGVKKHMQNRQSKKARCVWLYVCICSRLTDASALFSPRSCAEGAVHVSCSIICLSFSFSDIRESRADFRLVCTGITNTFQNLVNRMCTISLVYSHIHSQLPVQVVYKPVAWFCTIIIKIKQKRVYMYKYGKYKIVFALKLMSVKAFWLTILKYQNCQIAPYH